MEPYSASQSTERRFTLVLDIGIRQFCENRAFDREYMRQFPGGELLACIGEQAESRGAALATADVLLATQPQGGRVLCLSNMITGFTRALLEGYRALPAALMCLESPVIAYDFYSNLTQISGAFRHVFLFGGARDRVLAPETVFHQLWWPCDQDGVLEAAAPWERRKFMTLVNANKRALQGDVPPQIRTDPWFQAELYLDRLDAIDFFSRTEGFDLWGRGWENPVQGLAGRYDEAVRAAWKGEVPAGDKLRTLADYRFCLCFENCVFPGYLTEKLFDCFFAGCIPIYYGAPDIEDYVPKRAFVDYRDFSGYEELDRYLRGMTPQAAAGYLEAARSFLVSPLFDQFRQESVAREIVDGLEEVLGLVGW